MHVRYLLVMAVVLLYPTYASAMVGSTRQAAAVALLQERIAGTYVVKLRDDISASRFLAETQALNRNAQNVQYTYDRGSFQGFSSKLTVEEVQRLRRDSRVESVEPQMVMQVAGEQVNPPNWGLTRISQRALDLTKPYVYPDTAGEGVDVWVIDTGIQTNHTDFEGRAIFAKSFIADEAETDLHGHGTHVAGTVASKTYGVAKKARVFGVKALNAQGLGTNADVIASIQYVVQNGRPGKTVVNMSLGGDKSAIVDAAVSAAVDAGIAFIVAAGNESVDACDGSPSGNSKAFAVAASDRTDTQATFSNYGMCVKAYAPGVAINSLWVGQNNLARSISGTSMASPHVAGVAALYLAAGNINSVERLYKALVDSATPGAAKGSSPNTPNRLIYSLPS
ncbi:peptidase S8 and S53 subtilisin kexin sedolisin [Thamnocephalis sphaerospora]|uniref:Peptidase S8 and S53 subtilisin kexin sedolisin n=1 Tax=Thamnocephalis sphaerospora TaxID=78915 RepID=A0A4P9XQ02_9FUNG|nr:peptidase S8 and S53 subtilisin kexin sedolisin [Thamnocephalis sphaerospora]|eukprot:RKP08088.1 peptidase S8 and S53 subtilisin kexin sedolisin [Thamnocephalis sphaerospora]